MASNLKSSNIGELYKEAADRYGDKPAFATRNANKEFISVSFNEVYEMGINLATALIDLGIEAREHVGLLADNRLEWIVADYGIQLTGAADVPRGTDVTDHDITYILPHSDAKVVFVEHEAIMNKVLKNQQEGKLPGITKLIMMDKDTKVPDGVLRMYDLIEKGKKLRGEGDRKSEERVAQIKPDDLFTIIYTSGTTGAPKGVMLMHSNMISQVKNMPVDISTADRFLSILPIWHIFERVFEMGTIGLGACTYYTNPRNLGDDMQIVKPTFMASAPRLWENIYEKISAAMEKQGGVTKTLFDAAYFCAKHIKGATRFLSGKELDTEGRNIFFSLALAVYHITILLILGLPYGLLNLIVLKKVRGRTGGELRGTVSGGGALPLHVDQFFNNIGIPVLEGYGMTETAPGLAFRTPEKLVIGSVGPIFPETQIRLVDISNGEIIYPPKRGVKGEIHAKGPQVMKGYYKNPEATNKVLKDGWMNTGDLGMITFNNTLKIMGRSKETVVLMGGENVEPVPIEGKISESPLVDQVMVVGQDQKFLCALVVPALDKFSNGSGAPTHEELAAKDEVYQSIKKEVKKLVSTESGFKSFEKVIDVRIVPKPFEVGDELTNLFKMKRVVITDKYQTLIDSMYK